MDDHELEALLDDLESDRVEHKASISHSDRICEAICAFANDFPDYQKPGVLFIGVNDDGSCAHLPVDDRLLLTLSELRSNGNILPFPAMSVQKRNLKGCEVAAIIVEPSDDTPVRFKGRTWIRVGPRRAIATSQEERRLTEKRRARDLPFDIRPVPVASLNDLDLDFFQHTYLVLTLPGDIIEQNHRSVDQQLTAMRFASVGEALRPTVLGIGIPLARRELAKNGNPPPEFTVQDAYVLVILRKRA